MGDEDDRVRDKLNALTGLKFDQAIPVLRDTDPDWDRYFRQFMSVIHCHSYGRRGVRPYDVVVLLKRGLPANGPRLRLYNTIIERAQVEQKLPEKAEEVLEELKKASAVGNP